ncbi:MAG: hypothetical protein EXR71_20185 [Myxococcales bacterium]|nr:hypothetical protein [Myxococcales bacterium]
MKQRTSSRRPEGHLACEGHVLDVEGVAERVLRVAQSAGISPRPRGSAHRRADRRGTCAESSELRQPRTTDSVRGAAAVAPNQKWVGDVTYLRTPEGWVYLAVLLDLYSRRVVGLALSPVNDRKLALAALVAALADRRPEPAWIHHTDRGSPYLSEEYQKALKAAEATPSNSRRGNCHQIGSASSPLAPTATRHARASTSSRTRLPPTSGTPGPNVTSGKRQRCRGFTRKPGHSPRVVDPPRLGDLHFRGTAHTTRRSGTETRQNPVAGVGHRDASPLGQRQRAADLDGHLVVGTPFVGHGCIQLLLQPGRQRLLHRRHVAREPRRQELFHRPTQPRIAQLAQLQRRLHRGVVPDQRGGDHPSVMGRPRRKPPGHRQEPRGDLEHGRRRGDCRAQPASTQRHVAERGGAYLAGAGRANPLGGPLRRSTDQLERLVFAIAQASGRRGAHQMVHDGGVVPGRERALLLQVHAQQHSHQALGLVLWPRFHQER